MSRQPSTWRRYVLGLAIVMLVVLVDAVWLALGGHTVKPAGVLAVCRTVLILVLLAVGLRAFSRIRRYHVATEKLQYAKVSDMVAWCALLLGFVSATCVLSYLCVSVDAPVVERQLITFDRTLGFDWPAVYGWVQLHPHVHRLFRLAYASGRWQLLAIPLIVGMSARREALPELFFQFVLASGYLLLISTPFPATSAFVHFNVPDHGARATVSDFALLRSGSWKTIDISAVQGLVSMPSFHTALAVLFTYWLRKHRLFFCMAVPLNMLMILSSPTEGGHYLADVIAGLLLAVLTVQTYGVLVRRTRRSRAPVASAGSRLEMKEPAG